MRCDNTFEECVQDEAFQEFVQCVAVTFVDGYCSTVQGLLDWFEVDLGFTKLLFIQTDLCVLCVFVFYKNKKCVHDETLQECAHCHVTLFDT